MFFLNCFTTAPVRCFHLTAPILSGEKHLTSARCFFLNCFTTAPVRCFHLTAPILSGEKHLTSAKFFNTVFYCVFLFLTNQSLSKISVKSIIKSPLKQFTGILASSAYIPTNSYFCLLFKINTLTVFS